MGNSIRLGLLVPQTGPSGLWAASAIACAELATVELNEGGGVLNRIVDLVVIDAGATAASAAAAAAEAVDMRDVDAIVGMFPSFARRPVSRAVRDRVPFVYTPQFEGFERDPGVVTTGETARELLEPVIAWLGEGRRTRRYFLCGNDYVWPRASFAVARAMIRRSGGEVVGEAYQPIGRQDFGELLDRIAASGADVAMPYFLGSEAVMFNRAFAQAGLASRILRFTSAIDETILYGLGEAGTENLYVSSAYFASVSSRNNGSFLERYHALHGDSPPPANAFGESCYEGLHCLGSLIQSANGLDARQIRQQIGRVRQQRTARGQDRSPVTGATQSIHIARVDGFDFTVMQNK